MHGTMSVMEATKYSQLSSARDQYLRIHKHLVGPKTAEKLFFLYTQLVESSHPDQLIMAGWAAAESSLVAEGTPTVERLARLDLAEDAWHEAAERCKVIALTKSPDPNRSAELRITTNIVFVPTMKSLVTRRFDGETRQQCFDDLLQIAILNASEMHKAEMNHQPGRYGNHLGLAQEQISILAGNRLLSGRFLFMPSLARSGSGEHYPAKTHDLQGIHLRRGRVSKITPVEVKAGMSISYDAPVISGKRHLGTSSLPSLVRLLEAYGRERDRTADESDLALAQHSTESVMHLIKHFYREEELGRHCLRIEKCMQPQLIPRQRFA